jgi:hypothetical protein
MIEILAPSDWQMTFGERAAIEGILSQLRPRVAVEIGTAEGGSLQRIAYYSERVHSFDIVRPQLPLESLPNVSVHTGDSHVLLPKVLAELASEGINVDFALVDGDHSADGAERDLRDLIASDATMRTVIILHDSLNDDVRAGFKRIDYAAEPKVVYADLDFIGGHLSHQGPFHHELWGGLGIVVLDRGGQELTPPEGDNSRFYDLFEMLSPVRDALVLRDEHGEPVGPGTVAEAIGTTREELERTRGEAVMARRWLEELQSSASWRVTAPLRAAKRRFGGQGPQS